MNGVLIEGYIKEPMFKVEIPLSEILRKRFKVRVT
jgi:hypothetical protein